MNTKTKIAASYPMLTETERRIADYLMEQKSIRNLSLAQLARILDVGEASIIRFCRKLEFRGYQDLRFSLTLDEVNEKYES